MILYDFWIVERCHMSLLILCVVFMGFWVSSSSQAPNSACHATDLSSLRRFNERLDPRSRFSEWDFHLGDCCSWPGINCDNSSRVARLELGNRGLSGNISESLGMLDQLIVLNLSRNMFYGSIPVSVLHLPRLEILDLSANFIVGPLPRAMNLQSITIFNISGNRIVGQIPAGICINSSSISVLDLTENYFSGILFPEVGNCTSLKGLYIGSNSLTSELPENLFLLHWLEDLYLHENQFSGQLSFGIGNLSKLVNLDFSFNHFSGHLPDVFDRFEQLENFAAQSNHLTGGIPGSLANSKTITSLTLRNNTLSGTISINCSAMVKLVSLNLATNDFHGPIPETLSNCPLLRSVNFARISFSGQIPESFKNFSSLSSISLSNSSVTNITGALEIFQHCRNLTTLVLPVNFMDEKMPSSNSLQFPELRILALADCGLHGRIPEWLNRCRNLQLLDLSLNKLTGSIPPWFGNMSSLFYLDMSVNRLSGEIPVELTEMESLINGNVIMREDVSPGFPFLKRRNRTALYYRRFLMFPPTLALADNHLNGSIWSEFGNLKELHVLDLTHNSLSGPIPDTLSQMKSLESLDMSFNNLTGSIPSSLAELSFLSTFNVAHNFLSGPIPVGGQFSTFTAYSFLGNPGLCGGQGLPPCLPYATDRPRNPRKHIPRMAISVSVLVSAICVLCALFLAYRWTSRRTRNIVEQELPLVASPTRISYYELIRATANLHNGLLIGKGAYGSVYKALLMDGQIAAVKVFNAQTEGALRSFHVECHMFCSLRHRNLCKVISVCSNADIKAIVMEYMPKGSLETWLHWEDHFLDLLQRLSIVTDIACALEYLHEDCITPIAHCDIKPSNILLGEDMTAHLSDFGIAKLLKGMDCSQTATMATLGYIAPEYGCEGLVSTKCDIYSFGILLMEVFTGKRPTAEEFSEELTLRDWVRRSVADGVMEVVDGRLLKRNCPNVAVRMDCLSSVMNLALRCSMANPRERIEIKDVVVTLKRVLKYSLQEMRLGA